jgi:2-C-methyl-D-erythritol 4-phosphate cytidylyltransferase
MVKPHSAEIGALIVGAGQSERMGRDKMSLVLAGKPLLAWSVDTCQNYNLLTKIVIVLNDNNINFGRKLVSERAWSKVISLCLGGKRRQDSVREGLNALGKCDWIIIQDAARPFLTSDLLDNGLNAAKETGAAVAAVPVKDTIKQSDSNRVVQETLQRDRLWMIQTPQVFRFDIISKAYSCINNDATDDASLVEQSGGKIKLYQGSYGNIKITTPEDVIFAEALARGY